MQETVYHVKLFGIPLSVNPIALSVGSFTVYWYGVIIAVGFALALVYAWRNAKRYGIDLDRLLDVVLITTPCAILCARAYYLLFDPNGNGITGFAQFFGFNKGGEFSGFQGLAIYGGVIGAVGIGMLSAKWRKVNIPALFDIVAVGFLIGQGIGRWGNFTNQEAFGGVTGSSWWGMTSEPVVAYLHSTGLDPAALVHPCFLYESVWNLLGAFLLWRWSKKQTFKGQIALGYLVWYGFGRFWIEGLRTDSLYLIKNEFIAIRVSQALSAVLFMVGLIALLVIFRKIKRQKADLAYENVFGEQETDLAAPIEPIEEISEPTEVENHGDNH